MNNRRHHLLPAGAGVAGAALLAVALLASSASAQVGTVDFVFVAPSAAIDAGFPGAAMTAPFAPGFTGAWATLPPGYKGVLITAANVATFRARAPQHIRDLFAQLQTGTTLRNELNRVLTVSAGRSDIRYFLVDDQNNIDAGRGMLGSMPFNDTNAPANPHNGHTYIWPAAMSQPSGGGRFQGVVGMGEVWGDVFVNKVPGGQLAWEGVALHEGSHTQWVGEFSRWGVINQSWIVYGQGGHYTEEILGDQEAPHNEGIGTFYGYMHNNAEWQAKITNFFAKTDYRYFLDSQSAPAGWADLYNIAARQAGTMGTPPNTFNVWRYRWTDVPAFYILFSESTSTAFYMFFWQNTNADRSQALQMIIDYGKDAWDNRHKRFLTYSANFLALQLETWAGTAAGQAAKTAGTATSSMFPFALLDILTHFGMTDDAYRLEITRHYPDHTSRAATEYFNHRAAVRTRVQAMLAANPIRIEDAVREAHTYFRQAATILVAEGASSDGARRVARSEADSRDRP